MMALLLFIIFGLVFGYFATLNSSTVAISLGLSTWEHIPLYLVILMSLAVGVLCASLFYSFKSFSFGHTMGKKEKELAQVTHENTELTRKNHQLELENTRLKAQNGEGEKDENSL